MICFKDIDETGNWSGSYFFRRSRFSQKQLRKASSKATKRDLWPKRRDRGSCREIKSKSEAHDMHIKRWSAPTSSLQASFSHQAGRCISMMKLCSITIAALHIPTIDALGIQTDIPQQLTSLPLMKDNAQAILTPPFPLIFKNTPPGKAIKRGTELRILPVGDSITYGFLSDQDGGDGNGYRLRLRDDLSSKNQSFVSCPCFVC